MLDSVVSMWLALCKLALHGFSVLRNHDHVSLRARVILVRYHKQDFLMSQYLKVINPSNKKEFTMFTLRNLSFTPRTSPDVKASFF